MNPNICHERKLIFVHNPKAAGMSFRKWLGFDGPVNHGFPTLNVSYELWLTYTVVVVVRDPMERALSCYRFLTDESYQGGFTKVYPDIHTWSPVKFFQVMTINQIFICGCQYKYTEHLKSSKKPDYLFKFENMDTSELAEKFSISEPFPKLNVGTRRSIPDFSEELYMALIDYYKVDYLLFGYRPKTYDEFMNRQLAAA